MCRLFGMSAAPHRVNATFWLLDAVDSLASQSRREPDGFGLGIFDESGTPEVHKEPVAAYRDARFATEARELAAATFIAHVRYASTGGLTPVNTHPFCQRDRLFAHNGVIADLPALEAELGEAMRWVRGDTDSERLFALITRYAAQTGDVGAAITRAVRWVSDHLPVYAVNLVLTTATELWALRYPDTHDLYVLNRSGEDQPAPGTSTTPAPPARYGCAPQTWLPFRRWWSPPSGWTRIRAGGCSTRASCCTSGPTSRSPAGSCSTPRRRASCRLPTSTRGQRPRRPLTGPARPRGRGRDAQGRARAEVDARATRALAAGRSETA